MRSWWRSSYQKTKWTAPPTGVEMKATTPETVVTADRKREAEIREREKPTETDNINGWIKLYNQLRERALDSVPNRSALNDFPAAHQVPQFEFPKRENKAPEWQPIETAPRDGKAVAVLDISSRRDDHGTFHIDTDWANDGVYFEDEWTHWMPLPKPPKE